MVNSPNKVDIKSLQAYNKLFTKTFKPEFVSSKDVSDLNSMTDQQSARNPLVLRRQISIEELGYSKMIDHNEHLTNSNKKKVNMMLKNPQLYQFKNIKAGIENQIKLGSQKNILQAKEKSYPLNLKPLDTQAKKKLKIKILHSKKKEMNESERVKIVNSKSLNFKTEGDVNY